MTHPWIGRNVRANCGRGIFVGVEQAIEYESIDGEEKALVVLRAIIATEDGDHVSDRLLYVHLEKVR